MSTPPPPHDPSERVLYSRIGRWEVRDFAQDDPRQRYFAPRGFLHLQLWHPNTGTSVLTPSRLTMWAYEAFPVGGWKHRELDWHALAMRLKSERGVLLPPLVDLRALERSFLEAARIRIGAWGRP